ncbi:hypothetical protein QJQ45_022813, partial [Haematococcus lacustris]
DQASRTQQTPHPPAQQASFMGTRNLKSQILEQQLLASEATIRQLHSELQTAHLRSSLKLRRVKELDIMLHELHDVLEEGALLLDGGDLAEAAVGVGACEAASKALERRVQLCRHELATLGWQQEVAATASTIR